MKIFGFQFDLVWEDREANFRQVEAALEAADPPIPRGSLVVLPELFAVGFTMNVDRAADSAAAETEQFLAGQAQRWGITLLGGVCRRLPGGKGVNEAVAFDPGGKLLCRYRKIHPFEPAGEADAYEAGDGVATFDWNGFVVAPLICYDLRFPEVFRAAVAAGADLFCVIANWPDRRHQHKSVLLQARAIENQAFVLGVNRTGADPHVKYAGGSVLYDPHGTVLAQAGTGPELIQGEISQAAATDWRAAFPALRNRRTDLFPA